MNPAIIAAIAASGSSASSSDEDNSSDYDEGYEQEGVLRIDLKGTKIKTEARKNWLARIFLGKEIKMEQEAITQMQYLEGIYQVFKEMGYENILSLEMNDKTVYVDEENKDKDFEEAVRKAAEYESKEAYHIEFELDTTGDGESNIDVNMYGRHSEGDIPLVIRVWYDNKNSEDIKKLLEDIKTKINEKFGIESGEIEVDDDYEEEVSDEDTEESSEEEVEEETTDTTEEKKEEN